MVDVFYRCSICKKYYENSKDAQKCESLGVVSSEFPGVEVGDVLVRLFPKYSWHCGNKDWVCKTIKTGAETIFQFYWIVTAITREIRGHNISVIYHLATKAIKDNYGKPYRGRTTSSTKMEKVKNPPILDTSDLIGQQFKSYL